MAALLATTQLFGRVARDVADAYGFTYPLEMEQQVQSYLAGYAPPSAATVRDPHSPGQRPAVEARTPSASAPPSCQREDTVVVEPSGDVARDRVNGRNAGTGHRNEAGDLHAGDVGEFGGERWQASMTVDLPSMIASPATTQRTSSASCSKVSSKRWDEKASANSCAFRGLASS